MSIADEIRAASPLGDLSLESDSWLVAGDPEDVLYAVVKHDSELREFYKNFLCHPIDDELQVAEKIHRLKVHLNGNSGDSPIAKALVAEMFDPYDFNSTTEDAKDCNDAFTQLEALLKELHDHCPKSERVHADHDDEDHDEFDEVEYLWTGIFDEIQAVRKLLPVATGAKVVLQAEGSAARLGRTLGKMVVRYAPWIAKLISRGEHHEALWIKSQKVIRNRNGNWSYEGDEVIHRLERLRSKVRQALAESHGCSEKLINFHDCFENAVRYRYSLIHAAPWSSEGELGLTQRYLSVRTPTPWLTRFILETILDRRIMELRKIKFRRLWMRSLYIWLLFGLGMGVLFVTGFVWLIFPSLGLFIWRFWYEWSISEDFRELNQWHSVLLGARTEIASGYYDGQEVIRRLRQHEPYDFLLPTNFYRLAQI